MAKTLLGVCPPLYLCDYTDVIDSHPISGLGKV
jgi:hypothetical protein